MDKSKEVENLLKIQSLAVLPTRLFTPSTTWLETGDVMSRNVTTISSDQKVVVAANQMSKNNISCIVVVDNSKVVGILTETDFLRKVDGKSKKVNDHNSCCAK